MGTLSLLLTVVGIGGMIAHYVVSSMALAKAAVIVTGIVTTVAFVVAYLLGSRDMKRQSSSGGIRTDVFNPGLLAHGMSGTLFVVGIILCVIANVMKF